jgi:O-6-methylguanine DNA methyltransferase
LPQGLALERTARIDEVCRQIDEYMAGTRRGFDLPLHVKGTPFQEKVWAAIRSVPYGEVISYSALAQRAGRPDAIRAAATATGSNPISIVIPCHRIIRKSGGLGGFGGGLPVKRRLLKLEGIALPALEREV